MKCDTAKGNRVTLATLLVVTSLALAPDKTPSIAVMSLGGRSDTSAFVESLRIQLTGLASITSDGALPDGSRQARVARAHAFLETSGASIAVWQERVKQIDGTFAVVVLAITQQAKTAIEVARLQAPAGIDDERVLALKVGELLHRVLSAAKSEQELALALEQGARKPEPALPPRPEVPAPVRVRPWRARGFSEIGGFVNVYSTALAPPPGAKFGLGGAYQGHAVRAEGYAAFRMLGELSVTTPAGQVSVREYDAAAGVRALLLVDILRWGLSAELSANLVRASGRTPDGRQGSLWVTGYSIALGPEARVLLAPILELRALVQAQTRLTKERFALDDIPVAELSGVQLTGEFSLVFWTP